jgi:uncharacterized protein with PIN domain
MRLLAQLETRIEASVDTLAQTKEESRLRVVVQFAKVRLPGTLFLEDCSTKISANSYPTRLILGA